MAVLIEKQAVTLNELAAMLDLSPLTIRDWRKQRPPRGPRPTKLSATRQGRIRFPLAEVAEWQRDPAAYEARHNRSAHRGPSN